MRLHGTGISSTVLSFTTKYFMRIKTLFEKMAVLCDKMLCIQQMFQIIHSHLLCPCRQHDPLTCQHTSARLQNAPSLHSLCHKNTKHHNLLEVHKAVQIFQDCDLVVIKLQLSQCDQRFEVLYLLDQVPATVQPFNLGERLQVFQPPNLLVVHVQFLFHHKTHRNSSKLQPITVTDMLMLLQPASSMLAWIFLSL